MSAPELSLHVSGRSKVTTQEPPAVLPAVMPGVVTSVETNTQEDSFVYLHCHYRNDGQEMLIRVWRTTFLIDQSSGARSSLVHSENITLAPQWSMIPANTEYSFLLIFSALPKACTKFNFKEEIAQPGGFFVADIPRNDTDVYHIDLF